MTEYGGGAVQDFMHRYLEVVPRNSTIVAAAERMSVRRIGCLLVESDDPTRGPIGIVTEADLVRKGLAEGLDPMATKVDHVMVSPILTIAGERTMLDASQLMETHHVRHLCVEEAGEIVGIMSVRDLVRSFVDAESGPVCDLDKVYRPLSVLMATTIATIQSDACLRASAELMRDRRMGSLLTIEAGEIVGIVTERDLVWKGLAGSRDLGGTHVSAVMSSPLLGIDVNRTIRDASKAMAEQSVRHLAVTENGKIVGVLSVRDLVKMVSIRDRPRFLGKT
ncbi:MAG: CBS domain-containing protein [Nitrospira sp.]|nr:CBS domain-containing protein [Nitrospira sp.]MDH4245211.1 CBS domain-containing protein [Nitrospira sp.]MDH4355538.1 CBS domain-containing protein [Nitrospira sp.]MDH5317950.1 CBS domain-containing protein [Nitrospira sp.]